MAVLIAGAVLYIFIAIRGTDDIAGGVAVGLLLIFISAVIATTATVLERIVQKALRSPNTLIQQSK